MQGLTVQSLNEHSAVNDNSSLVLKVRVPCISKLNNEEIIIKDSLGAFETGHKRSVKHIYRRLWARKTIGVRNRKFVWRAFQNQLSSLVGKPQNF